MALSVGPLYNADMNCTMLKFSKSCVLINFSEETQQWYRWLCSEEVVSVPYIYTVTGSTCTIGSQ
jgi:hypothetical protein